MKTTLKDIAEDTGFSVATVSRVLNGSDKISSKTQETILKSARELEYLSPRNRNSENATQFLNVALIASDFKEGEFYVSFFHGLNEASKENNIRLSLISILDPDQELSRLIKEISLHYYDAAILFIPGFSRSQYVKLKKKIPNGFPVISNALIENPVFPTVTFDGYSGGYLTAQHFEKKSYHKLGLIQGPFERPDSRHRSNGFKDYIQQHSSLQLTWTYEGDFTFEAGKKAFSEYKKLDNKPRAIFGGNDDMANGFMEAAKSEGFNFPEDIAIMGYDDLPVCRHNQPTVSSIKTDYKKLGDATMKLIREKFSKPDSKASMLSFVSVSIVERQST